MEITAIVPNYNHTRFLERRLQSVYGQTCPHLKVILLDDASTDNSRDILETYRTHPRTQAIVYNDTNSNSPFLQWSKGLALVETEWVWIAESDDWCTLDFLEALEPVLDHPGAVMAYGQINWVDEQGNLLKPAPAEQPGWYSGPAFVRDHLFTYNRLQNAGMLIFRRSAAQQAHPRWMHMRQAGDYWLWAEIARQGRLYGSGRPDCYFTKHASSVSGQWLHTPLAMEEWVETMWQMHAAASITTKDIKRYIENRLIDLYCIRSGMDDAESTVQQDFWLQLAKKAGVTILLSIVKAKASQRKVRFMIKKIIQKPVAGN
jgi:hypothetical protein